jgi:hypothetical protein
LGSGGLARTQSYAVVYLRFLFFFGFFLEHAASHLTFIHAPEGWVIR